MEKCYQEIAQTLQPQLSVLELHRFRSCCTWDLLLSSSIFLKKSRLSRIDKGHVNCGTGLSGKVVTIDAMGC